MPALDFTNIPVGNGAQTSRDTFELFARDFLAHLGYRIESGPDRGADGGRDLIVVEERTGVSGTTYVRWLVSCKHKAHSGASVTLADESDVVDRLRAHSCDGFIGFYSTLPASSLTARLGGIGLPFQIWDRELIETKLLATPHGVVLAERYFAASMEAWRRENPRPALIFSGGDGLKCRVCSKDLLNPPSGIIVLWRKISEDHSKPWDCESVYWVCKGRCDYVAASIAGVSGALDMWEDIPDIRIPSVYLKWIMTLVNQLHRGVRFTDEALEQLRYFLIMLFPHVARDLTSAEQERFGSLRMIPAELGGFD